MGNFSCGDEEKYNTLTSLGYFTGPTLCVPQFGSCDPVRQNLGLYIPDSNQDILIFCNESDIRHFDISGIGLWAKSLCSAVEPLSVEFFP